MPNVLLVLNAGSSSLKFAAYTGAGAKLTRLHSGVVGGIGHGGADFKTTGPSGHPLKPRRVTAKNHWSAALLVLAHLKKVQPDAEVIAIGHRVVHGGPDFSAPQLVTPKLLSGLRRLRPFDPEHLPAEIDLIVRLQRRFPRVVQVACFDTAFHHDLPRLAQLLPLPRRYARAGLRRYGFHGLSYEFILGELWRLGESSATKGRVIVAHLGSGSSLVAIRDGRPCDTSMALTPAAGLMMGTRTGDIDPGVMIHLARSEKMSPNRLSRLVNHESGLLGVSGTSADMRVLLAREKTDERAADAVALFCYQVRKWIGAYTAAMGGLDLLVFTGGVGEHSPPVRARVCDGLGFLGLHVSAWRNSANAGTISTPSSDVTVRVIATDEELTIARHVSAITSSQHRRTLAL
jgi:acetate kinase